jgi:predicted membrane channel-forming protein YqfA (hemolysin III family)
MSASSLSFRIAVLFVLIGMILGVYMAASHNHTLGQAHAHINLIGWVSLFLIGLFYERRPQFDKSAGARWQVIVYTIGAVLLNTSLTALLLGNPGAEPGAAAGSIVVLGAMLWFGWLVFRHVDARA